MIVKSEEPDDVKSKKPYIQLAQAAYSLGADLTEPTCPWDTVRSAMRTLPPHAELPAESDETLIHAIYNHAAAGRLMLEAVEKRVEAYDDIKT